MAPPGGRDLIAAERGAVLTARSPFRRTKNNCMPKAAMAIRRRTGLIAVGIAALLLVALIFVGPALIRADRQVATPNG